VAGNQDRYHGGDDEGCRTQYCGDIEKVEGGFYAVPGGARRNTIEHRAAVDTGDAADNRTKTDGQPSRRAA
jgi:hypothetical protein